MIKIFYRWIRTILETKILGTWFTEVVWRTRHLYKRGWSKKYLVSIGHPHREQILNEISDFYPFSKALEVGCASGPNLILLSKRYPDAAFYGLDINANGIKTLNKYINKNDFSNIRCFVGKADNLRIFNDKSIDVVFTDAVLMFIGPDKIDKVVCEICRVAKNGIVLNEYHSETPPPNNYEGGRYIHDYYKLFNNKICNARIDIHKSTFSGGQWDVYGCLIKVNL